MNPTTVRDRGQAGYTLVELVVSSVLLATMVFGVAMLSVRGGEAQEYARRLTRVTEITRDIIDGMRLELVSSVRLFGNDAEGGENLAVFDIDGLPVPLLDSRMPTVAVSETLRTDVLGAEITGNRLFFAKLAWTDRYECVSGNQYLVDVYEWVQYYLTPEDGGPRPGLPIGLNIVRVVSEPLIDADSVERIGSAADREEVLLHLHDATPDVDGVVHRPAEVVWRRGGLPSVVGTLRQVSDADGSLSNVPIDGRPDPWRVLRSVQENQGMLSYRHHSIATIYSSDSFGVSRFSVPTTAGTGFPHGFEVQIVGPSSARQVLVHLVAVSTRRTSLWAWSDLQVSVDCHDL